MKTLNPYTLLAAGCAMLLALGACDREPTDYREFLNGKESVYPGKPNNLVAMPGRDRVQFAFNPSADPSVKRYRIAWNNGRNSTLVDATTHDPAEVMKVTVPSLNEDMYEFALYALDGSGNISVPSAVSVRTYGARYESGLNNRGVVSKWFEGETLVIQWATADTVHTGSKIAYTDVGGRKKTLDVAADAWETRVADCKAGEAVSVLSGYKPVSRAIDTFYALKPDTLKF
ncbi:DUF4998 domain-containing protein [Chitinophaga sp. NPDC101104]|uniref:DUF4998 domain-containing protein n=1 Tax=Chitinophaga sp. NPDC101104 TaxID=3390561 RepID=UPI003D000B09